MSFSSWPALIGVKTVGYVEVLGVDARLLSFTPTLNKSLETTAHPAAPFFSGEI
jgi:hypothetical protein